jgi:hypothetical protein
MADNFSKLWLQPNQNELAIRRAKQQILRQGRALPCRVTAVSGAIVTVEFEVDTSPWTLPPVTIPKAESPWIRMPTQVDDLGYTVPADAYLGGISGLGGGTATLTRVHNLGALVFVPVSNRSSGPDDPNAAQVCGPNGAIIRTTTGTTSSVVTNTDGTTITYGATTVVINAEGLTITAGGKTFSFGSDGAKMSNGVVFETHGHPYNPGSNPQTDTGEPVNIA